MEKTLNSDEGQRGVFPRKGKILILLNPSTARQIVIDLQLKLY